MIKLQGKSRIMNKDETLEIIREGRVVYREGLPFKPDDETLVLIDCNVQPFGPKDLLMVPEADRSKEWLWLFAENRTSDDKPYKLQLNDRIMRKGLAYQTQGVEDWGTFTQAKIVRIDVGPNRN